ncbi:MAG TPA: hypothetical protein VLI05_01735 [Candidatus Saccharimonadia bacterium]|nr:hypothetical protein [Candidatus Saccharimonadia bacterium]
MWVPDDAGRRPAMEPAEVRPAHAPFCWDLGPPAGRVARRRRGGGWSAAALGLASAALPLPKTAKAYMVKAIRG